MTLPHGPPTCSTLLSEELNPHMASRWSTSTVYHDRTCFFFVLPVVVKHCLAVVLNVAITVILAIMIYKPNCLARPTLSTVVLLAYIHMPCIYSAILPINISKFNDANSTVLPSSSFIRPTSFDKFSLLNHIYSRLCKIDAGTLCSKLNSSSSHTEALHQTRPVSNNQNFHKLSHLVSETTDLFRSVNIPLEADGNLHRPKPRTKGVYSMITQGMIFTSIRFPKEDKRGYRKYNKRMFIYSEETRTRIFVSKMRRYPYSNVVSLSTGCTGTLLTPLHVLTAAHCVHNGEDFRNNLHMLKVAVPDAMGFRMYYIQQIEIPNPWLRRYTMGETARSSYDYAVVKLSFAVAGRKRFMPLTVPNRTLLKENTFYLAFQSSRDFILWRTECQSMSNLVLMDGHLLLTRCDSSNGNSGAAVYTEDQRDGKRIIGVVSNTRSVSSFSFVTRFSVITAFTWEKLREICFMMAPYGQIFGVCPSLKNIPVVASQPVDNRILPFLG